MEDEGREFVIRKSGMERRDGLNQVFARIEGNAIKMLVDKVVDDCMIAGRTGCIKGFLR